MTGSLSQIFGDPVKQQLLKWVTPLDEGRFGLITWLHWICVCRENVLPSIAQGEYGWLFMLQVLLRGRKKYAA